MQQRQLLGRRVQQWSKAKKIILAQGMNDTD
jgi:hypothetical protein